MTKIVIFFNKIAIGNFVEKMTISVNFYEKNVKFWGILKTSIGNFPEGQIGTKEKLSDFLISVYVLKI